MPVRKLASDLTTSGFGSARGLAQKDFRGETERLARWVRDNIRYLKDIAGVETLHAAEWVLRMGAGDCDDKSILLAALLLSIGHEPLRFAAVAFEPDQYSHVWVRELQPSGQWLDLETTEPIPCGQSVPLRGAASVITLDI